MVQVWWCDTDVVKVWYRCGTGVVQVCCKCGTGVVQVLQTHLEHLKQVQTVVNRSEQQSGQNILNSFFKTFTDGLKIETQRQTAALLPVSIILITTIIFISVTNCWFLKCLSLFCVLILKISLLDDEHQFQ